MVLPCWVLFEDHGTAGSHKTLSDLRFLLAGLCCYPMLHLSLNRETQSIRGLKNKSSDERRNLEVSQGKRDNKNKGMCKEI